MKLMNLVDGREVETYSEEWREECEARHILSLRPLQKRRDYLEAIKKKRGVEAEKRMKKILDAIFERRKHAANDSMHVRKSTLP